MRVIEMPFDTDGITADLKVPGKRPRVFVNSRRPERRQRFTLAHEYGHIRIPWHMGTIIDISEAEIPQVLTPYWRTELEANRFASELLLPRGWLKALAEADDAATVQRRASDQAEVSRMATAIALVEAAPPGWLYARSVDGVIRSTAKSPGTLARKMPWGAPLRDAKAPRGAQRSVLEDYDCQHVWWQVDEERALPLRKTQQTWRELLQNILNSVQMDDEERKALARRLNGVLSSANSSLLLAEARSPERLFESLRRRSQEADLGAEYEMIKVHPEFTEFLLARVEALLE